jgi:hypothetical protein
VKRKGSDDEQIAATVAAAKLGNNGWYRANCPFCALHFKEDKRWSWGYNPESGYWHCFKCFASGWYETDAVTFVTRPRITQAPTDDFPLPDGFLSLAEYRPDPTDLLSMFDPRAAALEYLRGRGVSAELAGRLGFGVKQGNACSCCEGRNRCRYFGRLIMPVTVAGVRRGFVARALRKSKIPYLYPDGMPRGEILINQDVLSRETDEPALVMESWFDQLPYFDVADTVGTLGKPGAAHIELLAASPRPIVIVLDGDAWQLGRQVADLLRFRGKRSGFVKLPPTRDPNDVALAGRRRWLLERAWRSVGMTYPSSRSTQPNFLDTRVT